MSGYEVEHNIKAPTASTSKPHRPDLSTFFSTLDSVDCTGDRQPQNIHSLPLPQDIAATHRLAAEAFASMRGGRAGESQAEATNELLGFMVETMMQGAEFPPAKVEGVPDSFLAELERVPKKELKADASCPICANPFLDDPHPLVVRLPCHGDHLFDLECITPWLKLNPTCPMDRQKLVKEKASPPPPDEEDEEFDDMYA